MDKYGIHHYNKQLKMLQHNYDLEAFEAEMYKLQKDQFVDGVSNGLLK